MSYPKTTLLECYTGRFWKVGGTWGVVLPPDVRTYFRLTPGELMLMTIDQVQGCIVMRPARAWSTTRSAAYTSQVRPLPCRPCPLRVTNEQGTTRHPA